MDATNQITIKPINSELARKILTTKKSNIQLLANAMKVFRIPEIFPMSIEHLC